MAFVLMASILISCETEIEFNGKVTEPVLVANCISCTDSTLKVKITASRFFLSNGSTFKTIEDATVSLFVNGTYRETMTMSQSGVYDSKYVAKTGDVIRLNIEASGYESVWTQETIPQIANVQIDSSMISVDSSALTTSGYYNYDQYIPGDTIGSTYNYKYKYAIRLNDPSNQTNYYRLVAVFKYKYGSYEAYGRYINDFNDVVFGTNKDNMDGIFSESGIDYYNVFSDELIDGKTHTLTFTDEFSGIRYFDENYNPSESEIEKSITIQLQSISKSYYLYLKSLAALDNAESFMSEPVQIFTNVQNGLGLLGAKTIYSRKIILP